MSTTAIDLLLDLLKRLIIQRKNDLKVIIMSATINADLFSNFFSSSMIEKIKNKKYKMLEKYLTKSSENEIAIIVTIILNVHLIEQFDNILIFVFDVREMSTIIEKIEETLSEKKTLFDDHEIDSLVCLSFHATLVEKTQNQTVKNVASESQKIKFDRKLLIVNNFESLILFSFPKTKYQLLKHFSIKQY